MAALFDMVKNLWGVPPTSKKRPTRTRRTGPGTSCFSPSCSPASCLENQRLEHQRGHRGCRGTAKVGRGCAAEEMTDSTPNHMVLGRSSHRDKTDSTPYSKWDKENRGPPMTTIDGQEFAECRRVMTTMDGRWVIGGKFLPLIA